MVIEITQEIQEYIESSLNDGMGVSSSNISEFQSFDDGWETEILAFKWNHIQQNKIHSQRCVLRILQGESTNSRITRESSIMNILKELGVSVPDIYAVGLDDTPIKKGHIIMEFIEGKLLTDLIMENMDTYILKFLQSFVALHSIDWKSKIPELGKSYSKNTILFLTTRLNHYEKVAKVKELTELEPLISYLKAKLHEYFLQLLSIDQVLYFHNFHLPYNLYFW